MQILQKYEQMIQQVLTPQNGSSQIPIQFIQQCKLELGKIRSILDLHKNAEQEIVSASAQTHQGQRLKDALRNKQLVDETAHDYIQLSMKQTFFEQLSQITNRASNNTSILSQNNTSYNSVINQYQLSGLNKSFQTSITQKPVNQELLIFKETRQQPQMKQTNVKEMLQNQLNHQRQISTQLSQNSYLQRQQPQDMAKMIHERLSSTEKPVPQHLEDLPKYFNEKRKMQEANTQPLQSFQVANGQSMHNSMTLEDEAARIQENSQKEFLLQRVEKLNMEKQQQTIEIQQLKSDIASLNQILKVKTEQLDQMRDQDGQQHSIDEMQKVLDTLNEQSTQITQLQEKCKEYEAQLDPIKIEALETQLNNYRDKYETLLENSKNQADYGSLVKEQTKTIKVMEADNQQLTLEIKQLKQANEKLQQELTNTQILIDKSLYGSGDFTQELNQKDEKIQELQKELESVKAELEQLKAQKEE